MFIIVVILTEQLLKKHNKMYKSVVSSITYKTSTNKPTYCRGLISIILIPVTWSPFSIVCIIGEAPLQRGNKLGCTLRMPLEQKQ